MKITLENGLVLELNQSNFEAHVVNSPNIYDLSLNIPRSIIFHKQEYIITSIQENSFLRNCSITSITFAKDSCLKLIEKNAFSNSKISNIYLPSSLTEIQEGCFNNNTNLKAITISPSNKRFSLSPDQCFLTENKTEKLILICHQIQNATIPSFVKFISSNIFTGCKYLETINFSEDSQLKSIEKDVFSCQSLQTLTIPPSVEFIEEGWCANLPNLTHLKITNKNRNFSYVDNQFLVGKSDIKSDTFNLLLFSKRDIECAIVPSFIKRICTFSFADCRRLKSIEFSLDPQLETIDEEAFCGSSIERLTIPKNFKKFKEGWCKNTLKLNEIFISPENQSFSFFDHKQLIGKSDTKSDIYDLLLFASRDIQNAVILSSIQKVCSFSFSDCKKLKSIEFEDDSNLQLISDYAFANTSIESIKIPTHVKKISKFAFSRCNKLKFVTFSENSELEFIDEQAFASTAIELIVIPSHVKVIGELAFFRCGQLKTVLFQENSELKIIDQKAFNFSSIEEIKIPDSVQAISDYVFNGCTSLKVTDISENSELRLIGDFAFSFSSLTNFFVPQKIEKLGANFLLSTKVKSLKLSPKNKNFMIYDNKIIVGKSMLKNASNIENIVKNKIWKSYNGANNIFNDIYENDNNNDSNNNNESNNDLNNNEANNNDESNNNNDSNNNDSNNNDSNSNNNNDPNDTNSSINNECNEIDTDRVSDAIDDFDVVLYPLEDVEHVFVPSQIRVITKNAFYYYFTLKTIEFPSDSKLELIDDNAFCHSCLEGITVPRHVKRISKESFFWCKKIKKFEFSSNSELETIGEWAFSGSSIRNICIPSHVYLVEDSAFHNCCDLESFEYLGDEIYFETRCFEDSRKFAVMSFPNADKITFGSNALYHISKCFRLFVQNSAELNFFSY